jgi:hypothetical protein
MWEPQPLTPLWAFTACYRDSFTFFFFYFLLFGGEWSVLLPGRFNPGEIAIGQEYDEVERRKILPPPELELRPLGRPARIQSLYRLRYPSSHTTPSCSPVNINRYIAFNFWVA